MVTTPHHHHHHHGVADLQINNGIRHAMAPNLKDTLWQHKMLLTCSVQRDTGIQVNETASHYLQKSPIRLARGGIQFARLNRY